MNAITTPVRSVPAALLLLPWGHALKVQRFDPVRRTTRCIDGNHVQLYPTLYHDKPLDEVRSNGTELHNIRAVDFQRLILTELGIKGLR
jgi:hypothetical protein